jgi:CRISPR-associated exonuclease Cas4
MLTFRDLETAAYCPRKLYYRHRDPETDADVPAQVREQAALAFEYRRLLAEDDDSLASAPIAVPPTTIRARLGAARARLDAWDRLVDPSGRDVLLVGKDCRGVADKVLETSPPTPSLVFAGEPPERGVWHPQRVRAVAAAKALSWERETAVERTFAEYPAHGVVRSVPVDARRAGEYREALRTAREIDGPPPRVSNRDKCEPCEYRTECGVRTRSLRTLLE